MKQRWMHIALAILVLAQPVASVSAWAAMMGSMLDTAVETPMDPDAPPCHQAESDAPDCCDSMNGIDCGMDCGTASSAISQPAVLPGVPGHGVFAEAVRYAPPHHSPGSLFKPPRTS